MEIIERHCTESTKARAATLMHRDVTVRLSKCAVAATYLQLQLRATRCYLPTSLPTLHAVVTLHGQLLLPCPLN